MPFLYFANPCFSLPMEYRPMCDRMNPKSKGDLIRQSGLPFDEIAAVTCESSESIGLIWAREVAQASPATQWECIPAGFKVTNRTKYTVSSFGRVGGPYVVLSPLGDRRGEFLKFRDAQDRANELTAALAIAHVECALCGQDIRDGKPCGCGFLLEKARR